MLACAMVSRFACWLSLIHKKNRRQNLPTPVIAVGNGIAEMGSEGEIWQEASKKVGFPFQLALPLPLSSDFRIYHVLCKYGAVSRRTRTEGATGYGEGRNEGEGGYIPHGGIGASC